MVGQRPGDGEALADGIQGAHHGGMLGLDGLAISASTLCLVHCLVLPIVIAFLPSIAEWADWGDAVHIIMLVIAVPLSGGTLFAGWRRHRAKGPLWTGMAGLALLVLGLPFEGMTLGTALTVAGGMALAVAHVGNLRATRLQYLTAL
ncbi:MerC domain-containing protein [Sphingomonas sp.]|uniref:MerC domain-containing protein n=1 Tax=Sphingomonas sp. TaxID=28214 RepID=UPI00289D0728|nr:MerC domain-containing protein [Sphingomonas sp.]